VHLIGQSFFVVLVFAHPVIILKNNC
jgi:hypothetical protein